MQSLTTLSSSFPNGPGTYEIDMKYCEDIFDTPCPVLNRGFKYYENKCCAVNDGTSTRYYCCAPYFSLEVGLGIGIPVVLGLLLLVVLLYCCLLRCLTRSSRPRSFCNYLFPCCCCCPCGECIDDASTNTSVDDENSSLGDDSRTALLNVLDTPPPYTILATNEGCKALGAPPPYMETCPRAANTTDTSPRLILDNSDTDSIATTNSTLVVRNLNVIGELADRASNQAVMDFDIQSQISNRI